MYGWIMRKKEKIADKQDIISIFIQFYNLLKAFITINLVERIMVLCVNDTVLSAFFSHIKTFSDDTY